VDVIETIVIGVIVSAIGAMLAWMVHGLRTEMREEMKAMRAEFRAEIHILREEVRAIRSDLTQVALVVGVRPRAENA